MNNCPSAVFYSTTNVLALLKHTEAPTKADCLLSWLGMLDTASDVQILDVYSDGCRILGVRCPSAWFASRTEVEGSASVSGWKCRV